MQRGYLWAFTPALKLQHRQGKLLSAERRPERRRNELEHSPCFKAAQGLGLGSLCVRIMSANNPTKQWIYDIGCSYVHLEGRGAAVQRPREKS